MWMTGAGIKRGLNYGSTDELGYHIAENKVTVRDLQTTILHLLGLDPYGLTYKFQGLNNRLIGPTNEGKLIKGILA
jgi:hypothetical protein